MSQPRSPDASVVVVNWNRRELLRACLDSLAGQRGVEFEVVLVDNGSTDGSADMAEREFGGRLRLRVIRNARNRGFCAANNQGFAAASGPLLAVLNNDAEAEPGWLAAMRDALAGDPRTGMVACKILAQGEPARIDKAGQLIYPDGQNRGRGSGELDQGQYDRVEEVLWPDGCAAMYRRELIEQAGGFDEDFFAYGDDAELGLRARIAGFRCIYTPHAVVRHHRGATLGLASMKRLQLIERNRVLLAVKLFPWSLLWLNPYYYACRVAAGMKAALMGQGEAGRFAANGGKMRLAAALILGDLAALPLIPRMLRKRRHLASKRRLSPAATRQLILENRIALRTLSEQAV